MFVGRSTYRRRRMADAAALLPVLGALLMIMPLLWTNSAGDGLSGARTSGVMIYLFGVWGCLGLLSAVVSRHLRPDPSERGASDDAADVPLPMPISESVRTVTRALARDPGGATGAD